MPDTLEMLYGESVENHQESATSQTTAIENAELAAQTEASLSIANALSIADALRFTPVAYSTTASSASTASATTASAIISASDIIAALEARYATPAVAAEKSHNLATTPATAIMKAQSIESPDIAEAAIISAMTSRYVDYDNHKAADSNPSTTGTLLNFVVETDNPLQSAFLAMCAVTVAAAAVINVGAPVKITTLIGILVAETILHKAMTHMNSVNSAALAFTLDNVSIMRSLYAAATSKYAVDQPITSALQSIIRTQGSTIAALESTVTHHSSIASAACTMAVVSNVRARTQS
jgi:hypothetical protein